MLLIFGGLGQLPVFLFKHDGVLALNRIAVFIVLAVMLNAINKKRLNTLMGCLLAAKVTPCRSAL